MAKRILLVALSFSLLLLTACAGGQSMRDSAATAEELIEKATENLLWENELHSKDTEPLDELYLSLYFGVETQAEFFSAVSDYAVAVQSDNSADEIGIFKVNTAFDEAAFRAQSTLTGDVLERAVQTEKQAFVEANVARAQAFCQNRISIFLNKTENYDRAEYAKAQGALVDSHGYYVYYIISGDNASVAKIITAQIDAKAI